VAFGHPDYTPCRASAWALISDGTRAPRRAGPLCAIKTPTPFRTKASGQSPLLICYLGRVASASPLGSEVISAEATRLGTALSPDREGIGPATLLRIRGLIAGFGMWG
jgi:hypothetical protein